MSDQVIFYAQQRPRSVGADAARLAVLFAVLALPVPGLMKLEAWPWVIVACEVLAGIVFLLLAWQVVAEHRKPKIVGPVLLVGPEGLVFRRDNSAGHAVRWERVVSIKHPRAINKSDQFLVLHRADASDQEAGLVMDCAGLDKSIDHIWESFQPFLHVSRLDASKRTPIKYPAWEDGAGQEGGADSAEGWTLEKAVDAYLIRESSGDLVDRIWETHFARHGDRGKD